MTKPTILRTTVWLTVGDALALVASAIVAIVIARTYGAAVLGMYSFALAIAAIVQIIADAGYNIWLPRAIAQNIAPADELVASAFFTKILVWILCVPCAVGIAWMHQTDVAILTAIALLDSLASCWSFTILAALRGLNHYIKPQLLSSAYSVGGAGAMIATILFGGGVVTAVVAMVILSIGRALHLSFLYSPLLGGIENMYQHLRSRTWSDAFRQLHGQRRLWLVNIASTIVHRAPLVLLGLRTSGAELGYFAAAFRIYSAVRIVPGALFNAALPRLASVADRTYARHVLILGSAVAVGIAIVLVLSSESIIHWTFRFDEAVIPLRLLAIASAGLSLKTTLEALLIAQMHDRIVAQVITVSAWMTLLVAWIIPATATSFSVLLIASEWLLCVFFAGWLVRYRA